MKTNAPRPKAWPRSRNFGGLGGAGGYGHTAEGKLITPAFLDACNKMVMHIQSTGGLA
jgi:hypothetical protein